MKISNSKKKKVKLRVAPINKPTVLFNLDNLIDMLNGDNDMLYNIIKIFIDNTPKEIKKIESAINKGQTQKVNYVLHKIRPSVELVGGKKIIRNFTYAQLNCRRYLKKKDLELIVLDLVKVMYELVKQLKDSQESYIDTKRIILQ